jgi:hypothetical protein
VRRGSADIVSLEPDAAGAGPQVAREEIEQGGFAGTVRPDDGAEFSPTNREINSVHGGHATEATSQTFDLNDIHHGPGLVRSRKKLMSPLGNTSATARINKPSTNCQ